MNSPAQKVVHQEAAEWPPECGRLFQRAFAEWRRAGLEFVVLRNYERLPEFASGGVDILVAEGQLKQAEKLLRAAAKEHGYLPHNRVEHIPVALFFHNPRTAHQFQVELFSCARWRTFELVPTERLLEEKREQGSFFIPHPRHEALVSLLRGLLHVGQVKERYRKRIASAFQAHRGQVLSELAETFGPKPARNLMEAVTQAAWGAVEQQAGRLGAALAARQTLRRPFHTLRWCWKDAVRVVRRLMRPPGFVLVVCGPDGCGKSSVVPLILKALSRTFSPAKTKHLHWKPRVFSRERPGADSTAPHGQLRRGPVVSLAYFGFHWLEFFLGCWLRIRPATFKGGLVVVERFYYDFFVDQQRYRLQVPAGLVRLGYALLPKPDLVVLLDGPAEVLQARKQEVPFAETARQREAFLALMREVNNSRVVAVDEPAEQVAGKIAFEVLGLLKARVNAEAGDVSKL